MVLFQRVEINYDPKADRVRVNTGKYTNRQRKALIKLIDLFEAGKWDEAYAHYSDPKAFPYNKAEEYPEVEHIDNDLTVILCKIKFGNGIPLEELSKRISQVLNNKG